MKFFTDRVHRLPRLWSNQELRKVAHLFTGKVVNVSGWKDVDKEGSHYRDYFTNATDYLITNFETDARGFQGFENEIFLDLEQPLPDELKQQFDVVFNHTTLEHIFQINTAFNNLCAMSSDIVILIVPFLQQYHTEYGDYWRLSPLAIKRLFEENGFTLVYQSFNRHRMSSVYTFSIATRQPDKWRDQFDWTFSYRDPLVSGVEKNIGYRALPNIGFTLYQLINRLRQFFFRS